VDLKLVGGFMVVGVEVVYRARMKGTALWVEEHRGLSGRGLWQY